jgi:hypothetical protein
MSNYPAGRRPGSADPHSTLRIAALTAVAAGVVLLAAAAFVLSYPGIHQIALQAGVSPDLAKLYPVIFDAMLVVAGAAAMALRGAGWWSRFYAWSCLIVLLVALAVGGAVHATGTTLPERSTRVALAITPWVLLLLAFGLLLTMLSHFRKTRATVAARQEARAAAAALASPGGQQAEANGTVPIRAPVTWTTPAMGTAAGAATGLVGTAAVAGAYGMTGAAAGGAGSAATAEAHPPPPPPRFGLDFWLGPRASSTLTVEAPYEADGMDTEDDASHNDPVSYGEETGYVHPDSYRDEGEYSPNGDSGAPGTDTDSRHPGQDEPAGDGEHALQDGSTAGNGEGPAEVAAQADQVEQADQADHADAGPQAGQAEAGAQTEQADAGAQAGLTVAGTQAGQADAGAQAGQTDAGAQTDQAEAKTQTGQADAEPQAGQADASPQADQADAGAGTDQADAGAQAGQADAGVQADQADAKAQAGQAGAALNGKPVEEDAPAGPAGNEAPAGPAGKDASAGKETPAGKNGKDGASVEPVAAKGPVLERLRSTPTRPEE